MKSGYLSKVTTTVTRTCRCKAQKTASKEDHVWLRFLRGSLNRSGFPSVQKLNTGEICLSVVFNLYSDFSLFKEVAFISM